MAIRAKRRSKTYAARNDPFSPEMLLCEEPGRYGAGAAPELYYRDDDAGIWLYRGDSLLLLEQTYAKYPDGVFDMIFADPPYFLSDGGITCHAGKMVSVNKGAWDTAPEPEKMHEFNLAWLSACQRALKPNGTIFVSGTSHVIHSVGYAMQQLRFKMLNDIIWVKPNPPPNLSCRYLTHATETIIWAAKHKKSKHRFNYQAMREIAGGKQMKSIWRDIQWHDEDLRPHIKGVGPKKHAELFGASSAQKPLMLFRRLLTAASAPSDLVFEPFLRSPTTVVASLSLQRQFIGCGIDNGRGKARRQPQMTKSQSPSLPLCRHRVKERSSPALISDRSGPEA